MGESFEDTIKSSRLPSIKHLVTTEEMASYHKYERQMRETARAQIGASFVLRNFRVLDQRDGTEDGKVASKGIKAYEEQHKGKLFCANIISDLKSDLFETMLKESNLGRRLPSNELTQKEVQAFLSKKIHEFDKLMVNYPRAPEGSPWNSPDRWRTHHISHVGTQFLHSSLRGNLNLEKTTITVPYGIFDSK
jgi:hypothetical protein